MKNAQKCAGGVRTRQSIASGYLQLQIIEKCRAMPLKRRHNFSSAAHICSSWPVVMPNLRIQDLPECPKNRRLYDCLNRCWTVPVSQSSIQSFIIFQHYWCIILYLKTYFYSEGIFSHFGSVALQGRFNEKNIGFPAFIFWRRTARLADNCARWFPRGRQFKIHHSLQR